MSLICEGDVILKIFDKMTLKEICNLVEGVVVCGEERLDDMVEYAFASDLMSDVLTIRKDHFLLITGLANIQSIRTAEMSDVPYLLLCRNKEVTPEMRELAEDDNILIIKSKYSLFKCAGLLYSAGLKPVY
jgi:predicted transcriptional regulator